MKRIVVSFLFTVILLTSAAPAAFATSMATPSVFNPRIGEGNNSSLNWSGYAIAGSQGSITTVSGSWIVPSVTCGKGSTTYAAFWAGIDGFNSNTVEQAGTLGQCSHGAASYTAWYEFYPAGSVTIASVTVTPGDLVSVTVSYNSGIFTVTLIDGNQAPFTTTGSVANAALSSAECIAERPSIGGSITNLANFGTAEFGQDYTIIPSTCSATVGGVTGTFGTFGPALQEITMVNRHGRILAQPSGISTDGSSFTVTWHASN